MSCKSLILATRSLAVVLGLLVWFSCGLIQAQTTPSGDSYTNTADPITNYGAATLLYVNGAKEISYIQFNLASIPTTANISQATLKVYVNSVSNAGSFNVDYVNAAWLESTIDASNAPPLGGNIASGVNVTTADKNQYILINVTSAVQAWLSGSEANNGVALVANSTFNATFDSKENTTTSHPPELDIAFAGGEGTITGVTTASGSGLTGGGTTGMLNLSLTQACAKNQSLQWNGTAWACSSAGTGTITGVTAGTDLTGGGSSGAVTLNLDTTKVPLLGAANNFSAANVFSVTTTDAIDAYTASASNTAVTGINLATGGGYGVAGVGNWGLYGVGATYGGYFTASNGDGVSASGAGTYNSGVYAISSGSNGYGIYAKSNGDNGLGVFGAGGGTGSYGVFGTVGSSGVDGVHGESSSSQHAGVSGLNLSTTSGYGVYGWAGSSGGVGGGFFNSTNGDALYAQSEGGFAGFFLGDVSVSGNLSKSSGSFKIDHPLDPANKYLYHSFVESPDMKNIYDGVATLDANGEAIVEMPDWFGTLNRDFRYQLTCIGGFAPLYIAEKLTNNQFRIGGGKPGMEVSWQITGIRQDPWANAHRIPVEQEKEEKLKGFYLHPELYGAPEEKQIEWARHPEMMKKLQQTKE